MALLLSETIDRVFAVAGVPTLDVTNAAGKVTINVGAGDAIHLEATKRAGSQGALDALAVEFDQQGDTVTVKSHVEKGWFGLNFNERHVDFVITVPQATNVNARLSAGNLQIASVKGKFDCDLSAGGLEMQDITGILRLKSNAGSATIDRFGGMIDLQNSAGAVRLRDAVLTHDSQMRVNAGGLIFDGALVPGASLSVESSAGKIELYLPSDTSAHLDAATTAGKILIDGWPIAVQRGLGPMATASGDLNESPEGTIRLRSTAGSISVVAK